MRTYWMIIIFPKGTNKKSIKAFGFNILTDPNCHGVFVEENEYQQQGIRMDYWRGPIIVFRFPDAKMRKYVQKKYDLVNEYQGREFTFKK